MGQGLQPRKQAVFPKTFGAYADIPWRPITSDADRDRVIAAQLQHRWSRDVRRYMATHQLKIAQMAEQFGMNHERLGDLLRGEYAMGILDWAATWRLQWPPVPDPSHSDRYARPEPQP